MSDFTIDVKGYDTIITVTDFSDSVEARTSGPPEDCSPAEPGHVDWHANTGNDMLNEYIDNDDEQTEIIDGLLFAAIAQKAQDDKDEASIQAYEDQRDADFMEHW